MPDATEKGGALAAVYRMVKKKDGSTAIRITKEDALNEANKMSKARNAEPRNTKKGPQQAGSSSYGKTPKKK